MIDSPVGINRSNNLKFLILPDFLCLCAMIFNLLSVYFLFSVDYIVDPIQGKAATFLWVASVLLAGISAFLLDSPFHIQDYLHINRQSITLNFERPYNSIKAFSYKGSFWSIPHILIIAFIFRIIPIMNHGLFPDEWYVLNTARLILDGTIISPFGFIGDTPSNLQAFPVAFVLAIFKNPLFSIRLTGIIESLLTIFFLYLLLRNIVGKNTALVGSFLVMVSAWDIHMSTLGWANILVNPVLVSILLYLLYKVFKGMSSHLILFALAFFLSISLHLLYVAAMMVIPAIVVAMIMLVKRLKNHLGIAKRVCMIFGIYFFVCVSPLIPKIIKFPEVSIGRHSSLVQEGMTMAGETTSPVIYYIEQIGLIYKDFTQGEVNFTYEGLWGIALDPTIQLLTCLGILLIIVQVIRKKSDPYWAIILVSAAALFLIPQVLIFRGGSIWRSYGVLPIIFMIATYAIAQFSNLEKYLTEKYFYTKMNMYNFFLIGNLLIYLWISYPWFSHYMNIYLAREESYENNICQSAGKLIDQRVPPGSKIMMADEMCFPLVTMLYDENQYHFIAIKAEDPKPIVTPGTYLIIYNSRNYIWYQESMQKTAEQIIAEHDVDQITLSSTTQPVLYYIK
jgi:hypothetical protein